MSHTPGIRQARKQQTRQSLLDEGLRLLEHQNLSSLGLRELTRAVGVSPAAFYRHFPDMADLGVALVGESLGSLHAAIRATLADGADDPTPDALIERTVAVTAAYVDEHRPHIRFIARERHGGVRAVREAIAAELARFTGEVAEGLAVQPASAGWNEEDLRVLAGLYVDHMVTTASALLEATIEDTADTADTADTEEAAEAADSPGAADAAPAGRAAPGRSADRERIMREARLGMRIISVGRRHWLDPES